jgi:amidase
LIVTRERAAGAITVGKTNTPELGAGSQTFNEVFGATRKSPTTSRKRAAAAAAGLPSSLACGLVPLADGTDFGGFSSQPAAFCNIVGLRPSPDASRLKPTAGSRSRCGDRWRAALRDVALFLSAIAGPDPRSPLSINEDPARFRGKLDRGFKGVRVAMVERSGWEFRSSRRFAPSSTRIAASSRISGCITEEASRTSLV